jgi:hypothetical protein
MADYPLSPEVKAEIRAKLDADQPRTDDGFTDDGSMPQPIWSPWGFVKRGDRYVLRCSCGHVADAPLEKLLGDERADWPMHRFNGLWVCSACGGREMTFEVIDGPRRTLEQELAADDDDPDGVAVDIPEHLRAEG